MDAPFVILLVSIALTVKVIFPEVVTGVLPTVNSEDPPSAIPTLVTVPVYDGVTLENVIVLDPSEALVSVVHKYILSAFVEPS